MQISEVAQATGLTKKAIEYYCAQGLVTPARQANGYRWFSEEEQVQLQKIAWYRQLGLTVKEINALLTDATVMGQLLSQRQQRLQLACQQQAILEKIGDGCKIEDLAADIQALTWKESTSDKLLRMFPGYFGRLINQQVVYYLDEPLVTPQQQDAFGEIVDFLDQAPDLVLSDRLQAYLEGQTPFLTKEHLTEMIVNKEQSLVDYDDFLRENQALLEQYITYKNSEEYRQSPLAEITAIMREFCQTSGYYEIFIPALRKISPAYDDYYQKLLAANERLLQDFPEVAKW